MKQLAFLMIITISFSAYGMWPFSSPPPSPTKKTPEPPRHELQPVSTQVLTTQTPGAPPITINLNVAPTQNTTTSSSAASDAKTATTTVVQTETRLNSYLKSSVEYVQQV